MIQSVFRYARVWVGFSAGLGALGIVGCSSTAEDEFDGSKETGALDGEPGGDPVQEREAALEPAQVFHGIGDLPGGEVDSQARAVNSDGNVIVGVSLSGKGREAFRWSAKTGAMEGLGDLTGGEFFSGARGVSGDGNVVVGNATAGTGPLAFRWSAGTGLQSLGDLAGGRVKSEAQGISADGRVIVGASASADGLEAFRFDGRMTGLGDTPGDAFRSRAWAVSANGSVVVGQGASGTEAVRWVGGRLLPLGDLGSESTKALATAVSADGATIVGDAFTTSGVRAFRWTAAEGMADIGAPRGTTNAFAFGISADGTRIVGTASNSLEDPSGNVVFVWIAGQGTRSLQDLIAEEGGSTNGWVLLGATAISGDGKVVVGFGINPDGNTEAFRALLR